jgi:hypothetical protein
MSNVLRIHLHLMCKISLCSNLLNEENYHWHLIIFSEVESEEGTTTTQQNVHLLICKRKCFNLDTVVTQVGELGWNSAWEYF